MPPRGYRKPVEAPISNRWGKITELPKNRPVLIRGAWRPDKQSDIKGGERIVLLVRFDGNEFVPEGGFQAIDTWNVNWTEWRDLPE